MNSEGGNLQKAGAVTRGGSLQTAPAQFEEDDWVQLTEKGRKMVADGMAASIVRISRERDEAREARNECERQFQEKVEEVIRLLCERDEAREALADIALMDTSGLAAPAVSRAMRSLGRWKDILDAKTTQDLRQSMESAQ